MIGILTKIKTTTIIAASKKYNKNSIFLLFIFFPKKISHSIFIANAYIGKDIINITSYVDISKLLHMLKLQAM